MIYSGWRIMGCGARTRRFLVSHPDERSTINELLARRDAPREGLAHKHGGAHALLPGRGRVVWARHARFRSGSTTPSARCGRTWKIVIPEHADEEADALLGDAEALLQALELPSPSRSIVRRVMSGFRAQRCVDLECGCPGNKNIGRCLPVV